MMTPEPAENPDAHHNPQRIGLVLAVAAFFLIAVHQHLFSVNSQYYFTWTWKWIASKTVYPVVILLAIPFFVAQLLYVRRPSLVWLALAIITCSTFALMIGAAAVQKDPPGLSRISDVVQSRWTTGYFDEAEVIVRKGMTIREYLKRYPTLLPHFYMHPRQKPPGLVLIEMAIVRLFGSGENAAFVSGLLIGAVASCSVLATYIFIGCFTANRDAAFYGASYLALCPSLILFFPEFDICYPITTVCIAVPWALALRRNQAKYSVVMGLAYATAAFITYLPGVLPVFLIGFSVVEYLRRPERGIARIFKHLFIALGTFAAIYLMLWAVTGFDPIATLRACVKQQEVIWNILINDYGFHRHPWPGTVPTDLYDFALGSGWISYVLVVFYFIAVARKGFTIQAQIALVCVLQVLVVAATGVLITETARIWSFMLPMLMLPIGLELASWRIGPRLAVYFVLLLLMAAICQSMQFIGSTM